MAARKKSTTKKGKQKPSTTKSATAAKSKAAAKAKATITVDRRNKADRRAGADRRTRSEAVSVERRVAQRRVKVNRRRQIDPTTCERDYTLDEIEFMSAMDNYKRTSGRMFPTCSEVLEVIKSLGYVKSNRPETKSEPAPQADQPHAPGAMPSVEISTAAPAIPTMVG
ncbi:MAG: hypothetical protein JW959_11160 [Pirellulales bacterium]|nr:hypothetical protein [Pirellulales bacterium]